MGKQVQECIGCGESFYEKKDATYGYCHWCFQDDKEEEGRTRDKDIDYMYDGN